MAGKKGKGAKKGGKEIPQLDFANATKEELAQFALEQFGVELDPGEMDHEAMALRCEELVTEASNPEDEEDDPTETRPERPLDQPKNQTTRASRVKKLPAHIKFLKHATNGAILDATQLLWERGDMIACDQKGRPVAY